MSQQDNNQMQQHFYRSSAADFGKIPGSPVAYWLSDAIIKSFDRGDLISEHCSTRKGMATGLNAVFVRAWHEVSIKGIGFNLSREEAANSSLRWFPYANGGEYRKWYGNFDDIVNWENDGHRLQTEEHESGRIRAVNLNLDYIFKLGLSWTSITSGAFSIRKLPKGFLFSSASNAMFCDENSSLYAGLLNSKAHVILGKAINPTLNANPGDVGKIPLPIMTIDVFKIIDLITAHSKRDWDSFEVSWNFAGLPLMHSEHLQLTLRASYQKLRTYWKETTFEMQRLEEENNRLFIEAYGLQDELTPEVPLSEITLTCNPHYRYGGNLTDEEREARLQSDTICELISYAIGCMMGRYSLDREGLVYAHAGNEGFKALVEEGAYATFAADEDGILPLSTESWFADDVATRLEAFVRTVWGKDTLEENLQFIADSLCLAAIKPVKKGGETSRETLRRYLSTQFYKDHMKTYKKRPIYWLFSSGKEKAFECLVYLHRYNEATLPRMRTEYVTPLLGQMAGRIERLRLQQTEASTSDAKRIGKEIDSLIKQLSELRAFDDQLKHHADMRITLDLDDGVKVNYGKFGTLLSDVKAITGDKGE